MLYILKDPIILILFLRYMIFLHASLITIIDSILRSLYYYIPIFSLIFLTEEELRIATQNIVMLWIIE